LQVLDSEKCRKEEKNYVKSIVDECGEIFNFFKLEKKFRDCNDEMLQGQGKIEKKMEKITYKKTTNSNDDWGGSLCTRDVVDIVKSIRLSWGENNEKSICIVVRHNLKDLYSPKEAQNSTGAAVSYNFDIMYALFNYGLDKRGRYRVHYNPRSDKRLRRYNLKEPIAKINKSIKEDMVRQYLATERNKPIEINMPIETAKKTRWKNLLDLFKKS
jgi:hypothetical protein